MRVMIQNTILLILLSSCVGGGSELSIEDYKKWISEKPSELSSKNEIDELTITASYIPKEVSLIRQIESNLGDKTKLDSLTSNYKENHSHSFKIAFEHNTVDDVWKSELQRPEEYYDRLSYLNTSINQDFDLIINNKDTVEAGLVHLERTYGLGKTGTLLVSFTVTDITAKVLKLSYVDKIFGLGRMNFEFKELEKLPTLKI